MLHKNIKNRLIFYDNNIRVMFLSHFTEARKIPPRKNILL